MCSLWIPSQPTDFALLWCWRFWNSFSWLMVSQTSMDQKNTTERVMIDLYCRSKSPVGNSTYASFLMVVYGENALQGFFLLQYCEWPLGKIVCEAVLLYRGLNKTLMVERPVFYPSIHYIHLPRGTVSLSHRHVFCMAFKLNAHSSKWHGMSFITWFFSETSL